MKFNSKDVIVGFVLVAIIVITAILYKNLKTPKPLEYDDPKKISFLEEIKNDFKYQIPDDVKVIELKDISGGDGRGVATEKEILIDAADPESGYFYQAWLEKDDKFVSLGKLQMSKGGWFLEYDKSDYQDYGILIISLEKLFDSKIEFKILEGLF